MAEAPVQASGNALQDELAAILQRAVIQFLPQKAWRPVLTRMAEFIEGQNGKNGNGQVKADG